MALFHTTVLDNQIKALPTVDTASGSIATFDTDLAENLVEVKCQIVAKQASGTPSPSNPLPITTYTEMNVFATGKNLLPNVKWQVNTNRVEIGRDNVNDTIHLKSGTYTIKVDCDIVATIYYLNNGSTVSLGNTTEARTLILSEDIDTIFWVYKSGGVSVNDVHNFQLETGNEATTYEAYNGTTHAIPFGQTVANGVIDITTGVLEITHKAKDLGNLNYSYNSSNQAFITNDLVGISEGAEIILSCYTDSGFVSVATMPNNTAQLRTNALYIKNSAYTDPSLFKTAMNGQTIVYEANETIQLGSKTITALLNENNIWCDTGDTEVKFLLTVGKKIS